MVTRTSSGSPAGVRRPYAARMPLEERREQLMDAAIRLIARDGYSAISIDAIAREAGVTRPVVYSAYGGLEPLLHKLLDRSQRRALEQMAQLLPDTPDLTDADAFMLDVIRGLVRMINGDPDLWRPILALQIGMPREVWERIEADKDTLRQHMAVLLDLGLQMRGGPALDVEVTSHVLFAAGEHFARTLLEQPPLFSEDRLVAAFGQILKGLAPR